MSTTKAGAGTSVAPASTFKQRLAQRRKELEADAIFPLEVAGYPDLWANYRILGFEEIRGIGLRVEEETPDLITRERLTAATTLAEACVELFEFKGTDDEGKPILEKMGYRWSAESARELFDVELPEGVNAREALMAIFPYPRDLLMMQHFEDYLSKGMGYVPEIEALLSRELKEPSAPTSSG